MNDDYDHDDHDLQLYTVQLGMIVIMMILMTIMIVMTMMIMNDDGRDDHHFCSGWERQQLNEHSKEDFSSSTYFARWHFLIMIISCPYYHVGCHD